MSNLLSKILRGLIVFGISTLAAVGVNHFSQGNLNVGSTIPVTPAVFETYLASQVGVGDTSMTLNSTSLRDGSSLTGYVCLTVDSNTSILEYICGTATAGSQTITGLVRGIDAVSGTTTVGTLAFAHRRGADVKITDYPTLSILARIASGIDSFPQVVKYANGVTPIAAQDIPTKNYVDNLAFSGIITGANFPIPRTLVWYNGTTLVSTSTSPLYIDALNATSTAASSTIAYALGIATTTPFAKLSVGSGAIAVAENKLATSTSMTIDWRQGNTQLVQMGSAAMSIGFSGFIAGQQLKVVVCNPGSTAGTLTWSGVDWAGATNPSQTTSTSTCDVYSFVATQATSTSAGNLRIFGGATNGFQ